MAWSLHCSLLLSLDNIRAVGAGGAGGPCPPPPHFDRSVNPILTKERVRGGGGGEGRKDYANLVTTCPLPRFLDFLTALQSLILWKISQKSKKKKNIGRLALKIKTILPVAHSLDSAFNRDNSPCTLGTNVQIVSDSSRSDLQNLIWGLLQSKK